MSWPFRPKRIIYQLFIWKETDYWGYGSWNYWSTKKTSNNDNLEVSEEANVDEAVTLEAKASKDAEIYLKEELKKQAYK